MSGARVAAAAVIAVLAAACGRSGSAGSGGAAAPPAPPQLVVVKPMAGVLHVEWRTTAPCDFIEAERKDERHPGYVHAFEVKGDRTSHMDGDATMNTTYTYRLQCKVGAQLSGYSGEMSGNPTAAHS